MNDPKSPPTPPDCGFGCDKPMGHEGPHNAAPPAPSEAEALVERLTQKVAECVVLEATSTVPYDKTIVLPWRDVDKLLAEVERLQEAEYEKTGGAAAAYRRERAENERLTARLDLAMRVVEAARNVLSEVLACSHIEDEHDNPVVVPALEASLAALDAGTTPE